MVHLEIKQVYSCSRDSSSECLCVALCEFLSRIFLTQSSGVETYELFPPRDPLHIKCSVQGWDAGLTWAGSSTWRLTGAVRDGKGWAGGHHGPILTLFGPRVTSCEAGGDSRLILGSVFSVVLLLLLVLGRHL